MLRLLRNAGGESHLSTKREPENSSLFLNPLKHDLAAQKRNMNLCLHFRLPLDERLVDSIDVGYTRPNGPTVENYFPGRLYLSQTFLAFESVNRQSPPQQQLAVCWVVLPLYTIKRVERLNSGSYSSSLAITTWHGMEHVFQLRAQKTFCEHFSGQLGKHLRGQTSVMKRLKTFLSSCESEKLLNPQEEHEKLIDVDDNDDPKGGFLGQQFGYPGDARKAKDKSKMRLWAQYFKGIHLYHCSRYCFVLLK